MFNDTEASMNDSLFNNAFSWHDVDDGPHTSIFGNDTPFNIHENPSRSDETSYPIDDLHSDVNLFDYADWINDELCDVKTLQDVKRFDSFDKITSPVTDGRDENEAGRPNPSPILAHHDEDEEATDAIEEEELEPKYELRPQARFSGHFITTWVDQDDTGDFDPSEENRQAALQRNRKRLRQRALTSHNHTERNAEEAAAIKFRPALPPELIVKLPFKSLAGAIKFSQLTYNLPEEKEQPWEDATANGYSLRKRDGNTRADYNDQKQNRLYQDIPSDPTGHPFARGCWGCVNLGHDCSLLENEHSWPCNTCLEDNEDCEPVVPPKSKRACERCKRRRIACSYNYTLNHGITCLECMQSGQACLAGPAKDSIRTRIRYDRDWGNFPLQTQKPRKTRNYLPCAECREASKGCSFETKGNQGIPCTTCLESGDLCTLSGFAPQQEHTNGADEAARDTLAAQVDRTKESERDSHHPTQANRSVETLKQPPTEPVKTITTKFCHPIYFNHEANDNDNPNSEATCHFCEDIAYGILGLEEKQVEVTQKADGQGLEEIRGGHKDQGVENTRMCPSCTLDRLSIVMCTAHDMEHIPGIQEGRDEDEDNHAALLDLLSGKKTAGGREWCSLCPTPASFQCRTFGEGTKGCGLLLCKDCQATLGGVHGGDLQMMLEEVRDEISEQKPLGLRADWEFLRQEGLLMRFVLWSHGLGSSGGE